MSYNRMICGDARNITKLLQKDSTDLSFIVPPYHNLNDNPLEHIDLIKTVLKQITTITKTGGICCLIISNDMDSERQVMDVTETKALIECMDDPFIKSNWIFADRLLCGKSSKKAAESLNPIKTINMISFADTPFSSIEILVRSRTNYDYDELNLPNRIKKLKISQTKKMEMLDPFWYIPPKSEKNYNDRLPVELITRLIMILSKKNDVILDPFAGHGITAVACKTLNRRYFCIEKDFQKINLAKRRLAEIN